MLLVSEPEPRLLVRSPAENNHETTLVVPELAGDRVEYFKCLVDAGSSFEEHAVVVDRDATLPLMDRALVQRALTAARPTTVTIMRWLDERPEIEPGVSDSARAASAICSLVLLEVGSFEGAQEVLGLNVARQGKFYVCS